MVELREVSTFMASRPINVSQLDGDTVGPWELSVLDVSRIWPCKFDHVAESERFRDVRRG